MAGGSNGYRAALVRRQLTPGLISSLPGTAGLRPFISFSTSYPELPGDWCAARTYRPAVVDRPRMAFAAVRITSMTKFGLESMGTWLLATS